MPSLTAAEVRAEFPITDNTTYLDSAYWGPYPKRTADAISNFVLQRSTKPFPFGRADADRVFVDSVRAKTAEMLGVLPKEIWFPRGTTEALSTVASALLRPGDEIIVGGLDHPADYTIWANLAERGIQVKVVPQHDGHMDPNDIEKAISSKTRAIGMCLVNTYNGYRQDLDSLSKIAGDRNLYLFIDAIQGIGHLDIDLAGSNVTVMSAGVYKWLCSPEGMGVAYINRDVIRDVIPHNVHFYGIEPGGGWAAFLSKLFEHGNSGDGAQPIPAGTLKYPDSAARLEISPSIISLIGLGQMLDIIKEFGGISAVESRVLSLATQLRSKAQEHGHDVISPSDPAKMSGVTSVVVPRAADFAEFAKSRGIHVLPQKSPTSGDLIARVSPHIFNDDSDIDALVEALDEFAKK